MCADPGAGCATMSYLPILYLRIPGCIDCAPRYACMVNATALHASTTVKKGRECPRNLRNQCITANNPPLASRPVYNSPQSFGANAMRLLRLQLPLVLGVLGVLGLALVSWISGIDATSTATQTYLLWAATAIAAAFLALRLLPRVR